MQILLSGHIASPRSRIRAAGQDFGACVRPCAVYHRDLVCFDQVIHLLRERAGPLQEAVPTAKRGAPGNPTAPRGRGGLRGRTCKRGGTLRGEFNERKRGGFGAI